MKILLTGSQGQLGQSIVEHAQQAGLALIACDKTLLDITDMMAVQKIIQTHRPQGIINTAAYTSVDKAESEAEHKKVFAVNAQGAENLAKVAGDYGIPLIHFSTDYIFDGEKASPYLEDDTPNPLSIYGQSKWAGEEAIRKNCEQYIILRVSWVFGEYGHNFVKTMLRLMKERETLQVVSDQTGCPTYTGDIAEAVLNLIQTSDQWGTYHYTGTPHTTWSDFAKAIYTEASTFYDLRTKMIHPILSSAYPRPAKRPQNSVLNCHLFEKVFHISLQPWQKGLKRILGSVVKCRF